MKFPIVAERMNHILQLRNMSQQDLSDLSGVGKSSISHYANGTHSPGNVTSAKLAKILRVNPMWLMGYPVSMEIESPEEKAKEYTEIIDRLSRLSDRDRTIVMNMIDSMLSGNDSGA